MQLLSPIIITLGSPENYCDLCNLFFKNRHQYRRHYRKKHMILPYKPSSRHRPPVNPHLSPDLNDPNHYCRACEKKFPSQTYYRRHAKTAHKIRVTNPFYPNYDPNMQISMTQTFTAAHAKNVSYLEKITLVISRTSTN